jgi:hypothetical protein
MDQNSRRVDTRGGGEYERDYPQKPSLSAIRPD